MRIIITGTPGTGKTTIAKALAKAKNHLYINELEFCRQHGLGKLDEKTGELVVPVKELASQLKKVLAKEKGFILEGHLVCEAFLPVDLVVVLACKLVVLEKRLSARKNYSNEKVLDNFFCEQSDYCYKKAVVSFGVARVLRADNSEGIKKTLSIISKAFDDSSK